MEKVSIIVPVYNGEAHLLRCAESILAQDYPELELILVDDGSRDASFELMRELAARDTRVKAIHKENGGVSSARNRGLDEASGRYIQFSDVDDWLPIDATKLLMREIEASDADLVIGDFYRVVGNNVSCKGSIDEGGLLNRQEYADEMLRSPADLYYGALWNKLYRRDLIERYGVRMDETISYSEDMIFNLEYLLHADKIAVLKAPVYYYEYTPIIRIVCRSYTAICWLSAATAYLCRLCRGQKNSPRKREAASCARPSAESWRLPIWRAAC